MSIDPPTPKYAEIVNAVRARIIRRQYRVGDMLPSESQLVREFNASRSTVVRALEYLRQQGWLQGVQGKGRVVLRETPPVGSRAPERVERLLRPEAFGTVTLLGVEPIRLGEHLASAMALPTGAPAIRRRRLVTVAGIGPVALSTAYIPDHLAAGTDVAGPALLLEGLVAHLQQRRTAVADRVVERFVARRWSPGEAELLQVDRRACLTAVLLVALDPAGQPLFAVDSAVSSPYDDLTAVFTLA